MASAFTELTVKVSHDPVWLELCASSVVVFCVDIFILGRLKSIEIFLLRVKEMKTSVLSKAVMHRSGLHSV